MIKKFKIFESIEDDYYTILIKLEEISKRITKRSGRIYIDEKKENNYITFTYIWLSNYISGKYEFDPIRKAYEYPKDIISKNTLYREKIKINIPILTMYWLDIQETDELLNAIEFYYAPDEKKFENVDEIIKFLRLRYYRTEREQEDVCNNPKHWSGKWGYHPAGRRKYEWDEEYDLEHNPFGEEVWKDDGDEKWWN